MKGLTLTLCCIVPSLTTNGASLTNAALADTWITNFVQFPAGVNTNLIDHGTFQSLRAEANAGRLKVFWSPQSVNTNASVTVVASADELGHWPVRDWCSYAMTWKGDYWETKVPVDDVDLPLVYFVKVSAGTATNLSPMRICLPRTAGLEEPSRIFWPFLEGFEMGMEGWSLLTAAPEIVELKIDPTPKNGHSALCVSLPSGKHSVTVATTRIRGWQIQQNLATGIRVWLCASKGTGRARFTLFANAFTTNQVLSVSSVQPKLDQHWQKIDLPFASFPKLPLASVDWFTIEFIGAGPRDFLIDDLQFLGPWKIEME